VIELRHLPRDAANEVITRWHRHHKPVRSHYWATGAWVDDELLGVVIVGRPVARALCNGKTAEVVRLACRGGDSNVGSRLLGSAYRAARAMGFTRLVSYTRQDEPGTVYRAAGWHPCARVKGRAHAGGNRPGRWLPGLYEPSTEIVDRIRWEIGPDAGLRMVNGEECSHLA